MRNYIVAEELANGTPSSELARKLGGIVTRMENITRQLRFFAAPGTETMQQVTIGDVINDAVALTRHTIDEAGVQLTLDNSAPDSVVKGNRQRLEQVLVNLLRNAVSAMEESDNRRLDISVEAEPVRNEILIRVADTGHGLNDQSLETLQEPFHTTRRSGEGMGLGLAISSAIVNEHNGRLKARQRDEGGACFTVALPMMSLEEAAE